MRSNRRVAVENILCIALLLAAPALPLLAGTWSGTLPVSVRNTLFAPPWEEARPAGLEPDLDIYANETALKYYPWYRFMNQAARSGQSLLWDPMEAAGTPFMAQWRTRVFSPFSIPFHFLPFAVALRLSILLKLAAAGCCAYYAARRFGLSPAMGLFAGLACQFSGPAYLWPLHPIADTAPWFPLLLPSAERLLLGRVRVWPLAAITIALMALGGSPETLAVALLFTGLYLLARRTRNREWTHFGWDFIGLSISVSFGLALAAVQILPYIEFVRQAAPGPEAPRAALRLTDLAAVFLPQFINPDRTDAASVIRLLHVGAAPILLLALWCALRRSVSKDLRRGVEAMFLTAVVMILLPVFFGGILARIPLLNRLRPEHFLITHAFAFSFLAAAAAEEWNNLDPEQCKAAFLRLLLYLPLMWGVLFAGIVAAALKFGAPTPEFWPGFALSVAVALAILILLGVTLLRPSVRWMGYCLALVACLTLWATFRTAVPSAPQTQVFPETAFVQSLQGMQARIAGSAKLEAWPLAGNGVPQVFAPAGTALKRYQAFMERTETDPRLLRRTGAPGLLLTKSDIRGPFATVRPMLHIQEVFPSGAVLFRDLDALPRARMVYAGRRAETFDPAQLNSAMPPLLGGVTLPEQNDGPEAQATIVAPETTTRITVKVEATRPGVLVLADTWYPGWYATVNGKHAPVFPVDGTFRGVELGEGAHEVVFRFDPTWYRLGTYISLAAALVVLMSLRRVSAAVRP
jgi:hypothetical protein